MGKHNQQFDDFDQWQDNFRAWIGATDAICFDMIGRRCTSALHFKRAKDEGRFPVMWLTPDQVGGIALFSIGCRSLKYEAERLLNYIDAPNERDQAEARLRDALAMLDRVGTPRGADQLHRKMLLALLTDAAFDTVASFEEFFRDVETWKSSDGAKWSTLMLTKIAALQEKLLNLQA